ncbi:MAG: bifunctional oligoribonuclease/PAP phosphatase NrnA [Calditrichaeota bacterium]|nr:MAG: bifunctional oligoribonuclease/PAP phosphatase NrnA [Calditrichota bacterium]
MDELSRRFSDFLQDRQNILISTHINPDGDGVGSEVAIRDYLRAQGKQVTIVNDDPVPHYFTFLDPLQEIKLYADSTELFRHADACIVVDVSEWGRLGKIADDIQQMNIPLMCIDHHLVRAPIGQVNLIDATASSTGELIYLILQSVNADMTMTMLEAIYVCLLTDTGSFRFNNTTGRTHRIAAELLESGVNFLNIYSRIYESYSISRSRLMGELLRDMRFECDNHIAWYVLSQDRLRETGAALWETEGFSELPRFINGVQMSLMFTEANDGATKVSFRSKGKIAVNTLAGIWGGGGHKYAAGAVLPFSLRKTIQTVIPIAVDYYQKNINATH